MKNKGLFGEFGGSFVDEKSQKVLDELSAAFESAKNDETFAKEYINMLKEYVGRPSPLYFAKRISQLYGTNIYLKREDLNHTGSHKINNTVGQILLAKRMGKNEIIAETGAGQHGVATATVSALMGMKCKVFMGSTDIERQMPNVKKMELLGAEVISVSTGNGTLQEAVDEALSYWVNNNERAFYLLGSAVGPHPYPSIVGHFQSVISREIAAQLQEIKGTSTPDYVIACVGGGSNATGAFYEFVGNGSTKLIAAEAGGTSMDNGMNAAAIINGKPSIIHGFKTLVMLDNYGNVTPSYSISAGLNYPGVSPMLANLYITGQMSAVAISDNEALKAVKVLMQNEGIIPAIESAHAVAALNKMKFKPSDIVVVNISGRGDKDMELYISQL